MQVAAAGKKSGIVMHNEYMPQNDRYVIIIVNQSKAY